MTVQTKERLAEPHIANGHGRGEPVGKPGWRTPPLESGDRLTRAEFERRYTLHPELKKAELIEGVVYVASPLRVKQHGEPHSHIITWLGIYLASTPGLRMADSSTYRLDDENEPQPDVSVWIDQPGRGGAQIDADDYLIGAPELLVEVAASTASIDLGDKKRAYQRKGVQEYLVLQVYEQQVSWFTWHGGEYQEILADEQGILQSRIFPGLWLDAAKFWAGDIGGLLAALQAGLATPEHSNFVESLKPPKSDTR